MKLTRTGKILLLVFCLSLPLLFSGCYTTPTIEGNAGIGSGVFPEYSPKAPVPTATAVVPADLPTSPGGLVNLPSDSPVISPTGVIGIWSSPPLPSTSPGITIGIITPSIAPSVTPGGVLKLGAKGDEVRDLQTKLKALDFYKGSVDGDFGEATEAAVKAFQRQYKLTQDGIAGRTTLATLATARTKARPTATPTPRPTPTKRPTATPVIKDNTYLKLNDSGSEVRKMQTRLIELGYLSGTATGNFDAGTEAAVIAFQKRNCSYYDGIAGKDTLTALYSSSARRTSSASGFTGVSYREGASGSGVRALQTKLRQLGYYTGDIDGDYGAGTKAAVERFQRANRLTADGVAGANTLSVMYSDRAVSASQASRTATPKPNVPTALPTNVYVRVTPDPRGDYVTLRRMNYGSLVKKMQESLRNQGFYTGSTDGYFGEDTEEAVKRFQRYYGLKQDGVAGPATLRYLYEGVFPEGS